MSVLKLFLIPIRFIINHERNNIKNIGTSIKGIPNESAHGGELSRKLSNNKPTTSAILVNNTADKPKNTKPIFDLGVLILFTPITETNVIINPRIIEVIE